MLIASWFVQLLSDRPPCVLLVPLGNWTMSPHSPRGYSSVNHQIDGQLVPPCSQEQSGRRPWVDGSAPMHHCSSQRLTTPSTSLQPSTWHECFITGNQSVSICSATSVCFAFKPLVEPTLKFNSWLLMHCLTVSF